MSNYGSMPPPGPYTPPAQGSSTPGHNAQPQQQQNYQAGATSQARSGHKSGGVYGQMMQAVNTGKPMLDKLGKTISSKLSGKPAAGGPPQHLQSYQNYQQHQGQGQGQAQYSQGQGFQQQQQYQGQTYSPQPQQQQWQHPPHPQQPSHPPPAQAPNAFTAQQAPYHQSTFATPVSGNSGQSHYFPAQPPPNPPPSGAPSYSPTAHNTGSEQQYAQQGQYGHQAQPQGQYQQVQTGQYAGHQSGVVNTPSPGYLQSGQTPHMGDVSPEIPPNKPAQWSDAPSPAFLPPGPPPQSYHSVSSPISHNQQQQQWNSPSPMSPQAQAPPPPVSPPPHPVSPLPQQTQMQLQPAPNISPQVTQPPTPTTNPAAPKAAPTEFIAELPGDMGNMSLAGSNAQASSQYQAYQPSGGEQATSPTNRFSVPRRAVSGSSLPLADPWRFADPITEQPTREFYMLADLLFEALDRKFEPQNTGLLEAPKVLRCWIELTEEAHELFSFNNYNALARMWSLEGIPHVMVPVQLSLAPIWNFNQHSHAQDLRVTTELQSVPATYMPALNRAGWYKYFFLEMIHGPDEIGKLLPALCADTYKPGVLKQPDLNRRDRWSIPALQQRATQIQSMAIKCVCDEAKHAMYRERNSAAATAMSPQATGASTGQPGSSTDMASMMHEIQMASNDIAIRSVVDGEITYDNRPGGYGRLV